MTQPNHSTDKRHNPRRFASTLPAQGICWLSTISLFSSGGLVFAQTESAIDNIVPTTQNSAPAPAPQKETVIFQSAPKVSAPESAKPQPEFSERRARLKRRLSESAASPSSKEPVRVSKPKVGTSKPTVVIRQSKPVAKDSGRAARVRKLRARIRTSPTNPVSASSSRSARKDYNNAYIDPTDYSIGANQKYEAPSSVIVTGGSGSCRTVLGQGVSSNSCAQKNQRLAGSDTKPTPSWLKKSQNTTLATVPPVRRANTTASKTEWRPARRVASSGNTTGWRSARRVASSGSITRRSVRQVASSSGTQSQYRPNRFIPQPQDFSPNTTVNSASIAPSAGTLPPPKIADNTSPRPSNVIYDIPLASTLPQITYTDNYARVPYNGLGFAFPLSVPAPITSLFGWRTHPITGNRSFHAGTDIGAAMGTPVLAAYSGQVEIADWVGGYGLTVLLNHKNAQQTLYGHMSELLVQPGQWVEEGTVIGRVGSTGNSTGPHLHFEVRQLTAQGWVAVDPGVQLKYSLDQLVQALRTAQAPQSPDM